ncbi:hypothetical protein [Rodentibacter genomosp. 1]|uniref:hypothetical protein n=1 Tax=Rodentibacter genomosp. 1 TaxID=1908264 RepID=UPI001301339E|nr:hypothetical protein [Rodentibacter genomosp. 1]
MNNYLDRKERGSANSDHPNLVAQIFSFYSAGKIGNISHFGKIGFTLSVKFRLA